MPEELELKLNGLLREIETLNSLTVKSKIKKHLDNDAIVRIIRTIDFLKSPLYFYRRICSMLTWRIKAARLSMSPKGLRLHLGCGDRRLEGMLNCEYRATKAADVVMDCGNLARFKDNSASLIFSHAFFEHLYRRQQTPLLKDCYRVLEKNGALVFLMIPDFKIIAEAYLNHSHGHPGKSEVFDLFQVYRYTHGDPEMMPTYWMAQLHKSLFDREAIQQLLSLAEFKHWAIFNYTYPAEQIPLNLGFVAWKTSPENKMQHLRQLLSLFSDHFANVEQIFEPEHLAMS